MTKIPRIKAWTDGACEPYNPGGIASYGLIVKYEEQVLLATGEIIGDGQGMSNNVAEYCGLIAFIKWYANNRLKFIKQGMVQKRPVVYSDSRLMIKQMNGEYEVHDGLYVPYYIEAITLMQNLNVDLSFWWVPREENTEADALSKDALKIRIE